MRNILFALFLLFFTVGFVGEGLCHPADETGFSNPGMSRFRPFKKEAVRKKVEVLRIWKLTRALDIDEKTASRLFPLLHKYDKKRAEVQQSIREDKRALEEALERELDRQIRRILERLERKHGELQRLNHEEREELKEILTVEQQAKFVLFHHKFERDVKKILAEAKRRHFRMNR